MSTTQSVEHVQQGELERLGQTIQELDRYWTGAPFAHFIKERDEIIFTFYHLSEKRRLLMCIWNRWRDEKGPLSIPTGYTYTIGWMEKYGTLMKNLEMQMEVRDHLATLVGYRHISPKTVMACMKKLNSLPTIGSISVNSSKRSNKSSGWILNDEEEVEEVIEVD